MQPLSFVKGSSGEHKQKDKMKRGYVVVTESIRKLSHVRISGFIYKQIKRSPRYAIYAQKRSSDDRVIAYEVIAIRRGGGKEFRGKYILPYEMYPKTSQWGSLGWTYRHIEDAIAKYDALVSGEEKSKQPSIKNRGTAI